MGGGLNGRTKAFLGNLTISDEFKSAGTMNFLNQSLGRGGETG